MIFYRRWRVERYDVRTGRTVKGEPPEPEHLFWTERGALAEEARLNVALMKVPARRWYRFRTVRIYRSALPAWRR